MDNSCDKPLISPDSSQDPSNICLLSDESGKISYNNKIINLKLTSINLFLINFKTKKIIKQINLLDSIGSHVFEYKDHSELWIYLYAFHNSCFQSNKLRKRNVIKINFENKFKDLVFTWANAINTVSYGEKLLKSNDGIDVLPIKQRKAIVYINPVSGKGIAMKAWNKVVSKMLKEASIDVTVIITNRANHAYDHVTTLDVINIDFIGILSGDGLIYEIINGIGNRSDGDEILKRIPFAVYPGKIT